MLTPKERESIREAQILEYNTDYDTFEEYQRRIDTNESLSDEEESDLEYLTSKYNWHLS
jgi:biotin synthase-like enzyme